MFHAARERRADIRSLLVWRRGLLSGCHGQALLVRGAERGHPALYESEGPVAWEFFITAEDASPSGGTLLKSSGTPAHQTKAEGALDVLTDPATSRP